MLEQILSSSSQSAVLALLLAAPERSFAPKELSGRLRLSQSRVLSALSNFLKLGIVTAFAKGGRKYYLLNGKHKLLGEIKSSLKTRSYEDELFAAVRRLGQIRAAFLSGIFTGQPQLPVDILLVGKVNLNKLDKFLGACKKLMGQDINYSIMSPAEFQLRRDTFDRFIKDIFDYRHLVVVDKLPRKGKKTKPSGGAAPDSGQKFKVLHF
jgi:DNA-binding transcriptional ArsR family regulator